VAEYAGAAGRRKPARDAGVTLAGVFGVQALLVVTGVLLARGLGPDDRGYLALLVLISIAIFQLVSLGIPLSITYAIARDPSSGAALKRGLLSVGGWQLGAMLLAQAGITAVLVLDEPSRVEVAALVCLGLVPGTLTHRYGLAVLQGRHRFVAYNVVLALPLALFAIALSGLALAGGITLVNGAAAFVATNLAGGLTAAVVAQGELREGDPAGEPTVRWMLGFGARGMLGSSASPVETYRLDQAAVGLFLTPAALGYYVVAISFSNLPRFMAQSVGLVAYPQAAGKPTRAEARRTMWRFFWFSLPLYTAVAVVLWLADDTLVGFFFGDEFSGAVPILDILLLAALLAGARRVLSEGARGVGHPTSASIAEAAALVTLLPALVLLTPAWGGEGAAWAVTISSAVGLAILLLALRILRGRPEPLREGVEAGVEPEMAA
jgi:O-antigen/teichoic acid export membrane protein